MMLCVVLLFICFVAPSALAVSPSVHKVLQLPGLAALAEAQFTGYLPTGTNHSSPELFFWLMESRGAPAKDPLVLWLQGGPGCSGGLGLFWELGPYRVHEDKVTLYKNADSWNSIANVLMIDQPAGTGFSAVPDNSSIPVTLAASTKQLHFALNSFLELFPEFKGRDLWITGESYAGKYIPYLASDMKQQGSEFSLRGVAIGDGWSSPLIQTSVYGEIASAMSFIDENERAHVDAQFHICEKLVAQASWQEAQQVCDQILSYIDTASGNLDDDDIRRFGYDWPDDRVQVYMNSGALQQALGVRPQLWSVCSYSVADALSSDEMMPADHLYPSLWGGSDGIRVLFYNGQFDLNCAAAGTLKYLRQLLGDSVYLQAEKRVWRQDDSNSSSAPRGFVRDFAIEGAAHNVTMVVVAGAGHLVPKTQRLHSLEMLAHLIGNKPF